MDQDARIRIYIDGETEPSLDFQLFLAHGIGFTEAIEAQYTPWNTRRIAHVAENGGLYNTYPIPFSKSFKVTVTHPKGGYFFYIIRGLDNVPITVGNFELPQNTRLRLYKNVNVTLTPLEMLLLAQTSEPTAGMLFQVTLAANSTDFNYLEACMRTRIDNDTNVTFLSSGTEDFFLSAYYFNRGVFHGEHSGLTYIQSPGVMSAYKFFESDPILFTKSFQLMWRCGETINGPDGCPNDWPPPGQTKAGRGAAKPSGPKLANTQVTTYAWVYEYTFH